MTLDEAIARFNEKGKTKTPEGEELKQVAVWLLELKGRRWVQPWRCQS